MVKIDFRELETLCNRFNSCAGVRPHNPRQGYTSDASTGVPNNLDQIEDVVLYGVKSNLNDLFAELLTGYGIRPRWIRDNIGFVLSLPVERVSF